MVNLWEIYLCKATLWTRRYSPASSVFPAEDFVCFWETITQHSVVVASRVILSCNSVFFSRVLWLL